MVAVVTKSKKEDVEFKDAMDLMENNAEDGSSKALYREKFEEQSQQIEAMQAGLNQEAALGNIMAAQQAQVASSAVDSVTGEIIDIEDGFGEELSVESIISLVESGEDVEAVIEAALNSIAGKIAKDKKNSKKYLAHLMEILNVLEMTLGEEVKGNGVIRSMKDRLAKLIKDGNIKDIQQFLKTPQLRELLVKSAQQIRQNPELIQSLRLAREFSRTRQAYEKLSKQFQNEKDPKQREALKETLRELTLRAKDIQALLKQTVRPELSAKQFDTNLRNQPLNLKQNDTLKTQVTQRNTVPVQARVNAQLPPQQTINPNVLNPQQLANTVAQQSLNTQTMKPMDVVRDSNVQTTTVRESVRDSNVQTTRAEAQKDSSQQNKDSVKQDKAETKEQTKEQSENKEADKKADVKVEVEQGKDSTKDRKAKGGDEKETSEVRDPNKLGAMGDKSAKPDGKTKGPCEGGCPCGSGCGPDAVKTVNTVNNIKNNLDEPTKNSIKTATNRALEEVGINGDIGAASDAQKIAALRSTISHLPSMQTTINQNEPQKSLDIHAHQM